MPELSDAFCFIDPNQFEKVLVNLLSNALKFTPENGRIKASVDSYDETYLRVTVRDNGGGIRETDLPHVFDRFSSRNHVSHQTSADAGHMTPGTGIGLSLSKNLVERHGGTIHVESEWGFGSKFSILVRRGNDHFSPDELASEDDALTDTPFPFALPSVSTRTIECDVEDTDPKTSTLLLVEDNEDVRSYIRSCLETEYQVFEAGDGQEALEMIASNPPDLIISDIMMPRMDGLALCRALKTSKQWNHIPILLLTAQAGDEQKLEGLATRADDYVLKPFDSRELLLRVENLIRLRQLLQSRFSKAVVFEATRTEVQSADDEFLDRVRHCMEAGLSDPDFEVADVADQVGLSPRQFRRKIRSLTSVSPSGLLQSLRLQRAAQLLEQNFGTVAEVAYAVGYQQVRYFSRLFRHAYGVSPSEYGKDGEIIF